MWKLCGNYSNMRLGYSTEGIKTYRSECSSQHFNQERFNDDKLFNEQDEVLKSQSSWSLYPIDYLEGIRPIKGGVEMMKTIQSKSTVPNIVCNYMKDWKRLHFDFLLPPKEYSQFEELTNRFINNEKLRYQIGIRLYGFFKDKIDKEDVTFKEFYEGRLILIHEYQYHLYT
jgi:hypothetical protein